ncbi:MAG TPA: hypothetical protein VEW48_23225 [Thermoanaerobaculia bacterium]|nr:hypothetical protein [Thermoanaerobaculia bacterium]
MPKLSSDLRRRLEATPEGEAVEVVVELGQTETEAEPASMDRTLKIATLKRAFSAIAEPIERAIEHSGGTVLDRAWLNRSLKACLPREAVEALGDREDVELVDTPRALRSD